MAPASFAHFSLWPSTTPAEQVKLWICRALLACWLEMDTLPSRQQLMTYARFQVPEEPAQNTTKVDKQGQWLGCAHAFSEAFIEQMITHCLQLGYLQPVEDNAGQLKLTEQGLLLLKRSADSHFFKPTLPASSNKALPHEPAAVQAVSSTTSQEPGIAPTPQSLTSVPSSQPSQHWSPSERDLYQSLRALRNHLAQRDGVRHYRVCSNASLIAMVERKPRDQAQLLNIHRLGPTFWQHYGNAFLDVIVRHQLSIYSTASDAFSPGSAFEPNAL